VVIVMSAMGLHLLPLEVEGRHHLDPSMVLKAVKRAEAEAGLSIQASSHTFRHS
jgi:hypothetical protein